MRFFLTSVEGLKFIFSFHLFVWQLQPGGLQLHHQGSPSGTSIRGLVALGAPQSSAPPVFSAAVWLTAELWLRVSEAGGQEGVFQVTSWTHANISHIVCSGEIKAGQEVPSWCWNSVGRMNRVIVSADLCLLSVETVFNFCQTLRFKLKTEAVQRSHAHVLRQLPDSCSETFHLTNHNRFLWNSLLVILQVYLCVVYSKTNLQRKDSDQNTGKYPGFKKIQIYLMKNAQI